MVDILMLDFCFVFLYCFVSVGSGGGNFLIHDKLKIIYSNGLFDMLRLVYKILKVISTSNGKVDLALALP